jgi:hypothetical protein
MRCSWVLGLFVFASAASAAPVSTYEGSPAHSAWTLTLIGGATLTTGTYSMSLESVEKSAAPRPKLGPCAGVILEPPTGSGTWGLELGLFHLTRTIAYSQRIEVASFSDPQLRALPNSSPGITQSWLEVAPLVRARLSDAWSVGLGPYYARWIGGYEVADLQADFGAVASARGSWKIGERWFWVAEARALWGLKDVVSATERIDLGDHQYQTSLHERLRDFQALIGLGLPL